MEGIRHPGLESLEREEQRMTQEEYLKQVEAALKNADAATRDEILDDLRAHFAIGLKQGKSEDDIIASLGDVDQFSEFDELPKTQTTAIPTPAKTDGTGEKSIVVEAVFADVIALPSKDGTHHAYLIKDGVTLENSYLFEKTSQNGQLRIRLTTPNKFFHVFDRDLTIRLEVADVTPSLKIFTASGDVEVKDLTLDEFACQTASGDLQTEELCCVNARLHSASGDMHLHKLTGNLFIDTASGDAEVDMHSGSVFHMKSANGDLNYRGSAQEMRLNGASSDGVLNLDKIEHLTIDTVSGDYRIRLAAQVSGVKLDFKGISGECDYALLGSKGSIEGRQGKTIVGDGKTLIDIRCVSGDFLIED
jgi:hypothetical protein